MRAPASSWWLLRVFVHVFAATQLTAQSTPENQPPPIKDNSFLVEEAYNQEAGVVQHINAFYRSIEGGGWLYTFTQEWPVAGQKHQLSYTIPIARTGDGSSATTGLGDVAINYRYQIGGSENDRFALAPRLTVLLPTGDSRRGLGSGGTGLQVNLPFSATLTGTLVAHSNAGATLTPRARDQLDNSATTVTYALGQSVIWLVHPKINLMLESAWTSAEEVARPKQTARASQFLLSPGVRGAIDFASGLQIVPGLAFPFEIGTGHERAVFAYLSFEHPFGSRAR